ncbi:hypothetical protein GH714_008214 [Hevea brasiliensis]|uniref:Enoyl reductase (ER) domain-containing protein n=1 Tax=Hevea brasiliensis TaxID=3981 RepID=A0A6A6M0E4_HEVBR|nr:hypothetical protein GH714_008214 [Hevea brasiliensis]
MEALVCQKLGDPVGKMEENSPIVLSKRHPIPQLDSTTAVRVRVKATSLNYANCLQILGKYQEKPPLPFIPGSDYSGVVDAVGTNVSNFKGDHVCSFASPCFLRSIHLIDQSQLKFRVPEGCDLVAAAALPVAFGTSHVALVRRAHLTSFQVLLVLGAAGGVGFSAVQIGKVEFLKSLGVDHVVDSSKEDVTVSVKGVDVLYDSGEIPAIPANTCLF